VTRAQWRQKIAACSAAQLIFLDETSTQTVMTRTRGRAPRGKRVVGRVPRNHGPNVTCLAALGPEGVRAPCIFEGALDGELFATWVTEWLLPTLPPGTTVVLDNLSVHKNALAQAAIEAAGCQVLFLPPYSPDFNPIELAFAKLKASLRGVGARTFDALVDAIGAAIGQITPADIQSFYRHCGYTLADSEGQSP
jgi:transposase